jgi:hypothetical protein
MSTPPPYTDITGIFTLQDKHHDVTLAEYAGHARPGQVIIDSSDFSLHIGGSDGTFTPVGGGGGGTADLGEFYFTDNIMACDDEDIYIKAGDDLYLDALGDDVHIRSEDPTRI